jgi:hypothetical protein
MKKFDILWCLALLIVISLFIIPGTNNAITAVGDVHPYLTGFVKFAVLATMGELLALRIVNGDWKKPNGLIYRACIWGFLGITFVLMFPLFATGVGSTIHMNLLPNAGKLGSSFFTSALINLGYAPTFMAFHRITDTFIDMGEGHLNQILRVKLNDVIEKIDWKGYVSFVVLKTVPFFWIPAHTITFMLPPQYQIVFAAFLSIALGGILAFAKKRSTLA